MLTAVDVARRLADALDEAGITYAVGGAIALGYYATPRATVDVDINVFVPPRTELDGALNVLKKAGFVPDNPESLEQTATEDGQFRGKLAGIRVDVFVPAIEFYGSLAERKRRVQLLEKPIYILSPEDVLTLKLMFFRRKDLADAEAVLRGGCEVNVDRVRAALVEFVGESDQRIREWDALITEVTGEQ